jgi:hypothetical protein
VSTCEPRTALYLSCVIAVPVLILFFAFQWALLFYGYRWPAWEGWEAAMFGNGRRGNDSVTPYVVGDVGICCCAAVFSVYGVSFVWLWTIVPCNLVTVDETLKCQYFYSLK